MIRTALACLFLAAAPTAFASETASVADLDWLAGGWTTTQKGVTTREIWLPPFDGTMSGASQTTRAGHQPSFEFMTITSEAARPIFTAWIEREPPTPFVLKSGGKDEVVFENVAHDFPQRIIYRRCGEDLCARIEGTVDGQLKSMDWRYSRIR